jgi:hypothetical protein
MKRESRNFGHSIDALQKEKLKLEIEIREEHKRLEKALELQK